MRITRQSPLNGTIHTMDIPCTLEQYGAWQDGTLIQEAMPNLTPDEREFLITGITPWEWDEVFGDRVLGK